MQVILSSLPWANFLNLCQGINLARWIKFLIIVLKSHLAMIGHFFPRWRHMPYEWVQLSIIFTYTVAANTTTRSTLFLAVSSSLDTLNQHFHETPTRSHKKLRNCVCFTERKSNHKVRFYDPLFLRWVFIYYMIYSEHIYRVFERLGIKLIGESVKFSDSKHWSLETGFTSFDQVMRR